MILDLESQPLANDYLPLGSKLEIFPLALNLCNNCFHSQLSVAVDPGRLFSNYSYVSSTSQSLLKYFENFRDKIFAEHGERGLILDIGSNDGTFLGTFADSEWFCLGIDPAVNLVQESHARGVTTLPTFFTENTAQLLSSNFDVIVAMNVFAHTANPLDVLMGIKNCLSENGVAYIQTSQANMFFDNEFDTVYHEHISFFNVNSMKYLLSRANLHLVDVSLVPIHGISYLWKISASEPSAISIDREREESAAGLYSRAKYDLFADAAKSQTQNVADEIIKFVAKGYKIASYGAAAKGNTFLNFGRNALDYIFDDTHQKIGKMAPAGGCVVSHPSEMSQIQDPVLFIIPAWNFKEEILRNIRLRRNNKLDNYLVYYPKFEIGLVNS